MHSLASIPTLFTSIALHGALLGCIFIFSSQSLHKEEIIYHVSLAELSPPEQITPEPQSNQPPPESIQQPTPPPERTLPKPQPSQDIQVKQETKKISPKKEKTQKQSKPKPIQPNYQTVKTPSQNSKIDSHSTSNGPVPQNIGGVEAYKQSQLTERPSIVKRYAPDYPMKAKKMHVEGRIIIQVIVDKNGVPRNIQVKTANPPGYFEQVAIDAVNKMRFIPGKLHGKAVNTLVSIPFNFKLN